MGRTLARATPLLLLLLAACSGRDDGAGHMTVVGDLQLNLESGRLLRVTGNPVHLVTGAVEVDSALARVCEQRDAEVTRLRQRADSLAPGRTDGEAVADTAAARLAAEVREASRRAMQARERILAGRAVRTVETDSAGQFVFDSIQAGEYRVWADVDVGGSRWTWLLPLKTRGSDSTRVQLNDANADENPLRCRW